MSIIVELFDWILRILSIAVGALAFTFACGFYDQVARRYRPDRPWADYRWSGLGCVAFAAFSRALWLISYDKDATVAFIVGLTVFIIAIWGASSKQSRLSKVADVVEGMTRIQCQDLGHKGIMLTDPTPDRPTIEILYFPRCKGLETALDPKARNEMVIFTFDQRRYSIRFQDDEVKEWQENGRKIPLKRIKKNDPADLGRAHKILEISRVAARLVSAAR